MKGFQTCSQKVIFLIAFKLKFELTCSVNKSKITFWVFNVQRIFASKRSLNPMFWSSLLMEIIWNGYTLSIQYVSCSFEMFLIVGQVLLHIIKNNVSLSILSVQPEREDFNVLNYLELSFRVSNISIIQSYIYCIHLKMK